MRGRRHAPAAPYPRERPGTHCTGGWVDIRAGLDRCGKSRPHRDSIPGPSSPYRQSLYRLSYRALGCFCWKFVGCNADIDNTVHVRAREASFNRNECLTLWPLLTYCRSSCMGVRYVQVTKTFVSTSILVS